jgi:parvulin-like peptidyl-prolyl isomerase
MLLAAGMTSAPARQPDDGPTDDVLVTVGDEPITRADLSAFERRRQPLRPADAALRPGLDAAALEQLVDERLLRAAIAAAGIEIPPAQVRAAIGQLRTQLQANGGATLEKALEGAGDDLAGLERRIEFDLAVARLIAPRVDAAAIAAAFARHRRDLDGTRLRVSHVLLRPDMGAGDDALPAALRRAADIRRAILDGTLSFAEAAARHSAGPSRHRGGDLGFVDRRRDLNDVFAGQAFALSVGELSQPFATPFGVHVVTVTAVEPGTVTLEQVRPQAERLAAQHALRELLAELRKTTRITRHR